MMNADTKPPTGNALYQLLEVCDTNVWWYWNGTAWVLLGTNTLTPLASIPGDVSGLVTTSLSPNAPFWWNNGDQGGMGFGTGDTNLPFAITTSTTVTDNGYLAGQKLFEADTGNWFRWDGYNWIKDASINPVGTKATVGGDQEKGGGIATMTIGTTTQSVFNIPHGIGAIPSIFMVCPASAAAGGGGGTATNTIGYSVTADATNIIVTYQAGILSTSTVKFNWFAMN